MFCRSLFVLSYFFFCLFCCRFFFDLRILITPLVSSFHVIFNKAKYTDWNFSEFLASGILILEFESNRI
jgi:hypothetical protein